MKKILCLVLCAIIVFSLVACGTSNSNTPNTNNESIGSDNNNDDNTTNQEENISVPKYNLTYGEKFPVWGVTDEVEKPSMPELTWDEKEVDGVVQHKTNSPIEFDMNKLAEQLKQNSVAREMFKNIYAYSSENHLGVDSSSYGYYTTFKEYNSVVGENSDNKTTLSFLAVREPDRQNGWYTIEVRLSNLPCDDVTQDDIYNMVKIVFGDCTEFLVYGKDTDNSSDRNGDTADKYKLTEGNMVDYIGTEDSSYCLRRELTVGSYQNTFSLFLGLRVYNNKNADTYDYFFDDRSNVYVENAYTPNAVLAESFGISNPTLSAEFGVACLNSHLSNFTTGKLEYWEIADILDEHDLSTYRMSIKDRYYNAKNKLEGSLWYNIRVEKLYDEIQKLIFNITLDWTDKSIKIDSQEYIDKSIEIMKDLLGIEIQPMQYNGNFRNTQNVKIIIDGIEYDAVFDVNHNAGTTGVDITFENK